MKSLLFVTCAFLSITCNLVSASPFNSVLSTGDWYKFSTTETGIHVITYADLVNLGINASSIDPRNISIYGNGPGELPMANSAPRPNDLMEIAIRIQGESDGTFDPGDSLFFYSRSQVQYRFNSVLNRFEHFNNEYTDSVSFFLTVGSVAGKRIADRGSLATATDTTTAFTEYFSHEMDSINLLKSGKVWYGEMFDVSANAFRSFNLPLTDMQASSPLFMKVKFMGRTTTGPGIVSFSVNGQSTNQGISAAGTSPQDNYGSDVSTLLGISAPVVSSTLNIVHYSSDPNGKAWLDYYEGQYIRNLNLNQSQLSFRDYRFTGAGRIVNYNLTAQNSATQIWDVTNFNNVQNQLFTGSFPTISFNAASDSLREYIAFDQTSFFTPHFDGQISNQNLHAINVANMIIISGSDFVNEANILAQHHTTYDNLQTIVVDVNQIYNEFSGGQQDLVAIRDFIRQVYSYSGAANDSLKYVLLFGNATYDYKDHLGFGKNIIPIYESDGSLNPTTTYCSDDFLALLDLSEGQYSSTDKVDVAIGRIPVANANDATVINKIISYQTGSDFNSWRAEITGIADDEDGGIHLLQLDTLMNRIDNGNCELLANKIYIDEYVQQVNGTLQSYPDAENAIREELRKGTAIMQYVGHSGFTNWAAENVLDASYLDTLQNLSVMPAFLVMGQSFNRIDDPSIECGGRMLLMNPNGGGISSTAPTRLAFSSSNNIFNLILNRNLFSKINGHYPTICMAYMKTKQDMSSDLYIRNISFLGDPAVKNVFPDNDVVATQISADTLFEGQTVQIDGQILDFNGSPLSSFNGNVEITICNPKTQHTTLANDPTSPIINFEAWDDTLYHGYEQAINGGFSHTFIVPPGVDSGVGTGKISFYAQDGIIAAAGCGNPIIIQGLTAGIEDPNNISFQISPNPATTSINCVVDTKNKSGWSYTLMSPDGKTVFENNITAQKFSIERNSIPAGVYFLRISNEGGGKTVKVVFN